MSQAELSASRRIAVRYGLISSAPANDGTANGVASPSRKTTPTATRCPRSAASPTTAAPLECPTRTGASEPVSPFAVRNAISWSARCLASNGALGRLYPVPVRSMANTRWSVPSAAPREANVSAVSNAPGTRTTADPAVPQVRYRVSNPPALIMRRPAGRDAWPPVARSYPKLAPVMAAARTTTTTIVRRVMRRSRSATLAGRSPAIPVRDVRRGQRLSVLFRHDGPPGTTAGQVTPQSLFILSRNDYIHRDYRRPSSRAGRQTGPARKQAVPASGDGPSARGCGTYGPTGEKRRSGCCRCWRQPSTEPRKGLYTKEAGSMLSLAPDFWLWFWAILAGGAAATIAASLVIATVSPWKIG